MPIYEYVCDGCGEKTEVLQRRGDPTPPCPSDACRDGHLVRVLSPHIVGAAPLKASCESNVEGCRPCGKAGTGCGG
jgi:putative FmdB family regulatory protein